MLTALLVLVVSSPVNASNTADEAEVNFQLAADAYAARNYDRALFHFMLSNRLSPNRNVTFNIGRTYEAMGKLSEAFRWYQAALAASDDKGDAIAEDVKRAMEQLRPNVVTIDVRSTPAGATVYIDRKDLGAVGNTPTEIALNPGDYSVIIEAEGYYDDEIEAISLPRRGSSTEIESALEPIVGRVHIRGNEGATVHLGSADANEVCVIPCDVDLPEGKQILYFQQEGYRAQPSLVDILRNTEVDIAAELLAVTGTLIVDADQRGALIEVDGRAVGYTPAVLRDVRVGSRQIRISNRGYDPFETTIVLEESSEVDLGRVSLTPQFTVTAATRTAQAISEVPASVSLISAEEIRAFGYQTVYEAVAGTRGVYQTNDLSYQSIGVRGFGRTGDYGNRLLTTVDGHTANDDQLGSSYINDEFLTDLSDVQQIELVRGPGSALYGSNAVFGVLNVVTRDRGDARGSHVKVTGTDQKLRAKAGTGFGDKDLGGWISAGGAYGIGRDYQFDEFADEPSGGASINADRTRQRMLMGKFWAGDVKVMAAYYGREKSIPTASFGTVLGDTRTKTDDYRFFTEASYAKSFGNSDLDLRVYYDGYWYRGLFAYEPEYLYRDRYNGMWAGVEPRFVQHFGDVLDVTIGAETRQHFFSQMDSFETTKVDELGDLANAERPTFQVYSGYAIVDLHPGEVVRFNAGGRFDFYNTAIEPLSTFNPRAALIVTPGSEVFKVMGGTAFRAPSPFEYFYSDGGISQIKPDSLDPETVLTAEAEWTHIYSKIVRTSLGAYYNQIGQLIDTNETDGVIQFGNVADKIHTVGVEGELERSWRGGWMFGTQASWQRTRVANLSGEITLSNSPVWLASMRGVVPLGPSNRLAQRIRFESARFTKAGESTRPAVIWDVTLTGEIVRPSVSWGLGVRNLLDWKLEHPGGVDLVQDTLPQPGRDLFASLTVSL